MQTSPRSSSQKESPVPSALTRIPPPPTPQALASTSLLCLYGFAYSGTFHINGIVQDVVSCVWLPFLSFVFSRSTYSVGHISSALLVCHTGVAYCRSVPRLLALRYQEQGCNEHLCTWAETAGPGGPALLSGPPACPAHSQLRPRSCVAGS